ncbi:MAG: IS66 family transposase, partial [Thermoproteota archaeon]
MASIGQLYLLFSDRKIFPRRRVDPYIKATAVRKYTLGLSLAQVKKYLEEEKGCKVSREAIRKWFLKAGEILSKNKIKKKRGFIAADETVVFNLAKKAYLWAAREVKTGEIVALQVTRGRRNRRMLKVLGEGKRVLQEQSYCLY